MNSTRSVLPATFAATLVLAIPALGQDSTQPAEPATGNPTATANATEEQTYLGLGTTTVPEFLSKHLHLRANTGLLVQAVDPESPAAKAGFTADDIITKIDGNPVASQLELANIIHARKAGDQLEIDFIHEGTPGNRGVQLGSHRATAQADGDAAVADAQPDPDADNPNADPLRMADKLMRDAIEKARKNIGQQMKLQIVPGGAGGIQIIPGAGGAGGLKIQGGINFNSNIQMADGEGSIEMKTADGGTEVRVLDKAGKEVWSGPWETEQDKAAAPADIRQRIERLNGGNMFHLQVQQAEPEKAPEPAKKPKPEAADKP